MGSGSDRLGLADGLIHLTITKMSRGRAFEPVHGDAKPITKEYRTWRNVKSRCRRPGDSRYHRYGGRGIQMCDRWADSYVNFLSDMGRAPSKNHSIERIDNDGDYEPSNCKWATNEEQNKNKKSTIVVEYKGIKKTLADHCRDLNLKYSTMWMRIFSYGWPLERAFTTKSK